MHDLMVTMGLVFGLVALLATTHALHLERRWFLFGGGAVCIALLSLSAVMYYGDVFHDSLPVAQKVSLAAVTGWLITVHYAQARPARST